MEIKATVILATLRMDRNVARAFLETKWARSFNRAFGRAIDLQSRKSFSLFRRTYLHNE